MSRKAQYLSFDAIVGSIIFLIGISMLLSYYAQGLISYSWQEEELYSIANDLLSNSQYSLVNISDPGYLDKKKLGELEKIIERHSYTTPFLIEVKCLSSSFGISYSHCHSNTRCSGPATAHVVRIGAIKEGSEVYPCVIELYSFER